MRSSRPTWLLLHATALAGVGRAGAGNLQFLPAGNGSEWRREPLRERAYGWEASARGRRLAAGVSGNLETLGYYAADVCIGSPGSLHQLIIDTGSSMTAVPCATCTKCGRHKNPKYDPHHSATAQPLKCKSPPYRMRCSRCEANHCGYAVSYTEGSQIRGAVYTDEVHFGDGGAAFTERMVIGCQTYETGLFKGQIADGIMGISATRSGGLASPTPIDRLVEEGRIQNTFAFCLSDRKGMLVLGGAVRASRAHEVNWMPLREQKFYALSLRDIQIGGRSFGVDRRQYHSTIIDTGTTFLYLPPAAYRQLRDSFTRSCPWGNCLSRKHRTRYNDEYCYAMTDAERDAFAPLSLVFDHGDPLELTPREYTYQIKSTSPQGMAVRCLASFDNRHAGVVLGAAVLRNREVILDRTSRRVGFVRADCAAMEPSDSILENNTYLSNGCRRKSATGSRRVLGEETLPEVGEGEGVEVGVSAPELGAATRPGPWGLASAAAVLAAAVVVRMRRALRGEGATLRDATEGSRAAGDRARSAGQGPSVLRR